MMKRYLMVALLMLCTALPAAAAAQHAGDIAVPVPKEGEERKEGPLVVYSGDLMFVVKEPDGWQGDIENAPKIGAGVVLYRKKETFEKNSGLIAIRVARKVDENTALDLEHEMKGFRELYPDAEFRALPVKHPSYAVFSKLFSIPRSRHEYVTFVNPGKVTPYLFSIAMSTGSRTASKEELRAYREVVRSIEYVSQEGVKPPVRKEPGAGKAP
jgi:hypothetical protein